MKRVREFLRDPGNYPHDGGEFQVHETHISEVFLAGDHAYKLKKPVSFDFVDYSTAERREHFAAEEVRLNRRLAREIYLGLAFVREHDGRLRLDVEGNAPGTKLAALVRMKRLPRACLLDEMVRRGEAGRGHIDRLVDLLVPFHRDAPVSTDPRGPGSPRLVRETVLENFRDTEGFVGELLPEDMEMALRSAQLSFLTLARSRFERRLEEGKVRDGHGDLKAEHVAFVPECNVIDCIEFNDRLRIGDVAADIAFLKMDLDFLNARALGDYFLERYVEAAHDEGILDVLDFYASCRAHVRGKVEGLTLGSTALTAERKAALEKSARRHFVLAGLYARRLGRPRLVLVGGLSGTGKSTVSIALSDAIGAPVIRSDRVRKELAGVAIESGSSREVGFREGLYSEERTEETYRALARQARHWLEQGASVIVDATFSRRKHRRLLEETAQSAGAEWIRFECRVPREVASARLRRREEEGGDLSDATVRIQKEQEASYESCRRGSAVPLDTYRPLDETLDDVIAHLRAVSGNSGSRHGP